MVKIDDENCKTPKKIAKLYDMFHIISAVYNRRLKLKNYRREKSYMVIMKRFCGFFDVRLNKAATQQLEQIYRSVNLNNRVVFFPGAE